MSDTSKKRDDIVAPAGGAHAIPPAVIPPPDQDGRASQPAAGATSTTPRKWYTEESFQDVLGRLERLVNLVGAPGTCSGCGEKILWITTKAGRKAPIDIDGGSHFATCPKAAEFRRKKG